jgi:hypothetical protein
MNRAKYFLKNITVLNAVLLAAIISLGHYAILPLLHTKVKFSLPSEKPPVNMPQGAETDFTPPSPADYMIISEENLFHPERKIPTETKAQEELPKPEFVLYGTMLSNEISVAFVEDLKAPRSTPGRGNRQVALRKGDLFSGFTLKEIEQEQITMVRGEEKMIVPIVDPQKPKKRETVAPVAQTTPGKTPPKARRVSTPQTQARKQPLPPRPSIRRAQPQSGAPTSPLPAVDEKMRRLFQK